MRTPFASCSREDGFTLVELLVVCLILATLAAIAIPAFFAQREKAFDADAKAGAGAAKTAIETYATDHRGEYSGATPIDLQAIESTLAGADLTIDATAAKSYELTVGSESGNAFTVRRDSDGGFELTCAEPGRAGCPSSGTW